MRLLFFTDTHIRGTSPKNRKDNIVDTLEKKFKEIINIIKINNIDYVLHGGDLFDRPDISPSIVSRFAKILSMIEVPIYIVSGNHDIYGHNPETINRSMLGVFDAVGVVKILDEQKIILLEKDNIKVQLTGASYSFDIDTDKEKSKYIVKNKLQGVKYAIHIVHGMLLDRPFIEGIPYTLIDDIDKTAADITLVGHYHSGFGIIQKGDKYFVNPGSLIRITNSLKEIERQPQIAIIDLDDDIKIDLIPLKVAEKGEKVLDRKQIEISMYRNEKLMQFKQIVDSSTDFEKLDINHILNNISNAEGVSEEVKKEAMKRISISQMLYKGDEF